MCVGIAKWYLIRRDRLVLLNMTSTCEKVVTVLFGGCSGRLNEVCVGLDLCSQHTVCFHPWAGVSHTVCMLLVCVTLTVLFALNGRWDLMASSSAELTTTTRKSALITKRWRWFGRAAGILDRLEASLQASTTTYINHLRVSVLMSTVWMNQFR